MTVQTERKNERKNERSSCYIYSRSDLCAKFGSLAKDDERKARTEKQSKRRKKWSKSLDRMQPQKNIQLSNTYKLTTTKREKNDYEIDRTQSYP